MYGKKSEIAGCNDRDDPDPTPPPPTPIEALQTISSVIRYSNHSLWPFNVTVPRFHERSQLLALHDAVVRQPAESQLKPSLSLTVAPVHTPYLLRTAGHQYTHRALASPNRANITHPR